jgi:hypothetical protein
LTLRERMERVADELADHASDCFARSHSPKFDVDRQTLFFNEASAYKNSAEIIRIVLQEHAMKEDAVEEQADYRLVTDRKVCPLMSKADPDNPWEVQPVFCLGKSCGMYALCQGRIGGAAQ